MTVAWIDGAFRDAEVAHVSIHDRGFTLGDGLFETMRVYGGRTFRLNGHLRRLATGARRLGIPVPHGLDAAVRATIAANELRDAAVRITVTRGRGTPSFDPPPTSLPTLVITARPFGLDASVQEAGVSGAIVTGRLNEHGPAVGLKSLGRLDYVLARAEARSAGADAALIRDTAGHLAEADVANIFLVRHGELHTPPRRCGIIPGITRRVVIQLARAQGVRVRAVPLPPESLWDADEAFLTNSLREVLPLVAADGRALGTGRAGPLTLRLIAAYRALTASA